MHERLCKNVFASDHLFADDTPIPVLDPGRGRTKTGRLWVYAREQRPWGGPSRRRRSICSHRTERPSVRQRIWRSFKGVLHVDGYAGFERLTGNGDVMLAACWAHTRRKFYEIAEADRLARGDRSAAPHRRNLCRRSARPRSIAGASAGWRRSFSKPHRASSAGSGWKRSFRSCPAVATLAEAMRYALSRWDGLTRFLHDGRIELDTNPVERAIRPVALGRKNHLFAGSDGGGDTLGDRFAR